MAPIHMHRSASHAVPAKNRAAGDAVADGAAARQHPAKAHQRRASERAAHVGLVLEPLEAELAREPCGQERSEEHARHQADIEFEDRGVVEEEHQRAGRRAGEGGAFDRQRVEGDLRERVGRHPADGHGETDAGGEDHAPDADAVMGRDRQCDARNDDPENEPGHVGQAEEGQKVHVLSARGDPERGQRIPCRGKPAREAHLCDHGEDQPGDHRAQVAGGRQHQKPTRTATRQHHADAEDQPADHRTGPAAGNGHDAGILGAEQGPDTARPAPRPRRSRRSAATPPPCRPCGHGRIPRLPPAGRTVTAERLRRRSRRSAGPEERQPGPRRCVRPMQEYPFRAPFVSGQGASHAGMRMSLIQIIAPDNRKNPAHPLAKASRWA